jgi:sec-independent protein translocase protein TatA
MFGLGAPELLIILVLVLLVFGGSKLPKLARSLGQAKNEFEAGTREGARPEDDEAATTKPVTKGDV